MTSNKDSKNWQRRAWPAGCQLHRWVLFYDFLLWFIKLLWPQIFLPLKIEHEDSLAAQSLMQWCQWPNILASSAGCHVIHTFKHMSHNELIKLRVWRLYRGNNYLGPLAKTHWVWKAGFFYNRATAASTVVFTNKLTEKEVWPSESAEHIFWI